jgi:hypothetical protein
VALPAGELALPVSDAADEAGLDAALDAALVAALVAAVVPVDCPGELPHAARIMADAAMRAVVATTRVLIIDCPPRSPIYRPCHQAPVDRWRMWAGWAPTSRV